MNLALEVANEVSAEKINQIAIQAGKESTANEVIFAIAAWRMKKLEPWKHKPFRVDDREITSFTSWRNYMSEKVQGKNSPAAIDNSAQRIDYLVEHGVDWAQIVNALAFYPQAIEDLRQGPETKTNVKELIEELDILPNPHQVRLRVMEEQNRMWVSVKSNEEGEDVFAAHCVELLGTTPKAEFNIIITNWEELTESQRNWVRKQYRVVKDR